MANLNGYPLNLFIPELCFFLRVETMLLKLLGFVSLKDSEANKLLNVSPLY